MRKLILAILILCAITAALWAQQTPSSALLVLSKAEHTLAIVDPVTLRVVAKIPSGDDPHEVVASADGKLAFISNYGFGRFNTISVADLVAHKALPAIDLGGMRGPHGLDFAGGELYFTAEVNKVFGRYDPATQKIDWIMGTGEDRTHMVWVAPSLDRICTSNVNSGTVSIFEKAAAESRLSSGGRVPSPPGGNWEQTLIETGVGTEGFDVSPDGRELWSASAQDGTISVIDTVAKKVTAKLQANVQHANRVKFTPDGKYAFVSLLAGSNGTVAIFDAATRREVKRLSLGHGAAGILMQPDGSRAFVACTPDDFVAVIDLKTLEPVAHIEAGKNPDGMAWAVRK